MEARAADILMKRALELARRAAGDTSPNPLVGAVIVKDGRIIGEGYHRRAGLPHAEIEALRRAGRAARGATLYVTLEPCNHVGRTPPCCDAIVRAGLRDVVVAMRDPNPITHGRGVARLRRAGLRVRTGILKDEAQRLNAPFTKYITTGLPWTVAKVAQSLDGKIATRTGESRWISSLAFRQLTHQLRRDADAVVVGIETVLRDDPRLTARTAQKPPRPGRPIRVILDSQLRTPLASRCVRDASVPTVIATTARSAAKRRRLEQRGVTVIVLPPQRGRVPLRALCRHLASRFDVMSLLIEGGGEVLAGALQEQLVDRLVWAVAPMILGGRSSPSSVGGAGVARLSAAVHLTGLSTRQIGPDLVVEAGVRYSTRRVR